MEVYATRGFPLLYLLSMHTSNKGVTVASHEYTVKCELSHGNAGCKHICTLFSNSLQFACCVAEKIALTQ